MQAQNLDSYVTLDCDIHRIASLHSFQGVEPASVYYSSLKHG
jgi:hypothetical protein